MLTWCWSWIWTKHVGWVWASRPWTLDVAGSAWWSQHGRRYGNHYGMVIPSFVQGFLYVSIRFDMIYIYIYIYICISLYIIIYHYISLYIYGFIHSVSFSNQYVSILWYYCTMYSMYSHCLRNPDSAWPADRHFPAFQDQSAQWIRPKVCGGAGTYFLQAFCWEMLGAYHQKNIKKWRLKFWGSNKWLALCYCSDSHR